MKQGSPASSPPSTHSRTHLSPAFHQERNFSHTGNSQRLCILQLLLCVHVTNPTFCFSVCVDDPVGVSFVCSVAAAWSGMYSNIFAPSLYLCTAAQLQLFLANHVFSVCLTIRYYMFSVSVRTSS